MPTYEYHCTSCGHTLEEFQSITAKPLVTCPNCGKPSLKRILGAGAGMIFKGSGFYLTDYKNKGNGSSGSKKKSKPASGSTPDSTSKPKTDN